MEICGNDQKLSYEQTISQNLVNLLVNILSHRLRFNHFGSTSVFITDSKLKFGLNYSLM